MKQISLSLLTITVLSSSAMASDSLADAFKEGTTSGQIRSFYIDRTYTGAIENNRNSLAVGGNLGFETAEMNGVRLGAKFYTSNGINLHDGGRSSANYDPSLFGDAFASYSMVGEAYINYKQNNTNVKIGRQKLNTPLAGADDARMLPNLFEAVVLSNTDVQDTTLVLAHVTRESVGTFGNVYGTPSQLSLQSGYGLGYKEATNGHFADMGVVALGAGTDTLGVTAMAGIYKGIPNVTLQVWDYYAHDILNALYLQGDYGFDAGVAKLKASVQYIKQSEVGDKLAGEVDSQYLALKLGASAGDVSGYVAYSKTGSSNTAQANGGILTPWGGIPAFTQGMVTRHMFFADTKTSKVAVSYKLNTLLDADVKATVYHVAFDIGQKNSYKAGQAWKAKESGFDIQYKPSSIKNLNLRLRANYPKDFAPNVDWAEYRLIANYNF